jgi:hypothetical protein
VADKRPSLLDSDEELAAFLARMTSPPEPIVASHDFRLGGSPNLGGQVSLQAQPQGTGYGQGASTPVYNPSAKLNLGPLSLSGGLTVDQMTNPDTGTPYTRTSPNFGAGLKVPLPGDATAEAGFNLTPNQLLMLEAEYRRKLLGGDLSVRGNYGQPLGADANTPPSWGVGARWSRKF